MKVITDQEKKTLIEFIERNIDMSASDMDEGIGTVYERIVIDRYFDSLMDRFSIDSVLESPADGVTGIPGINSLEFARKGKQVFLTNPSDLMLENASRVWEKHGLRDMVEFTKAEVDSLPYPDAKFDLVWNYCMFERFEYPEVLVKEMLRVSGKYLMIMTQNFWNLGTFVHWIYHKVHKLKWDHGHKPLMTFKGIRKCLRSFDLEIVEEGAIDTPPWMDTWDMPLRGEIKKILSPLGFKWEWKVESEDKPEKEQKKGIIDHLADVENNLPEWFNCFQTHHLYILCRKKK
jgi:hypothetical protein